MEKKVRKELIGSTITKGHIKIVIDDTKECKKICKLLKLDVFEEPKKATKAAKEKEIKDVEPK